MELELFQPATGDRGIFFIQNGALVWSTSGDETYSGMQVQGDTLLATYTYTSDGCTETWTASIQFPPGFLGALQSAAAPTPTPTQSAAAPTPTQSAAAPTPTQSAAAPTPTQSAAAPTPTQSAAASPPAATVAPTPSQAASTPTEVATGTAEEIDGETPTSTRTASATADGDGESAANAGGSDSGGLPWVAIALIAVGGVVVLALALSALTGWPFPLVFWRRGDDDDGDDPRDTPPPVIYGERVDEPQNCDWEFVVVTGPDQEVKLKEAKGSRCCWMRLEITSEVIERAEDLDDDKEWATIETHTPQIRGSSPTPQTSEPRVRARRNRATRSQSVEFYGLSAQVKALASGVSASRSDMDRVAMTDPPLLPGSHETTEGAVPELRPLHSTFSSVARAYVTDTTTIDFEVKRYCPPDPDEAEDQKTEVEGQGFVVSKSINKCDHGASCGDPATSPTLKTASTADVWSDEPLDYVVEPDQAAVTSGSTSTPGSTTYDVDLEIDGDLPLGPVTIGGKVSTADGEASEARVGVGPIKLKGHRRSAEGADHNRSDPEGPDPKTDESRKKTFKFFGSERREFVVNSQLDSVGSVTVQGTASVHTLSMARSEHELKITSQPQMAAIEHPDRPCKSETCRFGEKALGGQSPGTGNTVDCCCYPVATITFGRHHAENPGPHCRIDVDGKEFVLTRESESGHWILKT